MKFKQLLPLAAVLESSLWVTRALELSVGEDEIETILAQTNVQQPL